MSIWLYIRCFVFDCQDSYDYFAFTDDLRWCICSTERISITTLANLMVSTCKYSIQYPLLRSFSTIHHSTETNPNLNSRVPYTCPDLPKFPAPLRLTAFSKDGARQDSGRGSAIPCHVVRLAGNLGKKFMMRWTAAKCWVNVGLSQKIWGYHRIVWGKHLEPGWKMRIWPSKNRDLTISSGDAKWIWLCLTWV
jgi:hypothetical protein